MCRLDCILCLLSIESFKKKSINPYDDSLLVFKKKN